MKDTFSYLEDIADERTISFYQEQNDITDTYLRDTTHYFGDELAKIGEVDLKGLPHQYKKNRFWIQRDKEWEQPKLLYATGKNDPEVLLDMEGTGASLDYWKPSPDGTKLVYGISVNGNEESTLHVLRVRDRKELIPPIPFAGYTDQGDIVWISENSFIYPRMNGYEEKGPRDKWLLGTKLYRHSIGRDASLDELVFGTESSDIVMPIPVLSSDSTRLYVASCEDELTHQVYVVNLQSYEATQILSATKSLFSLRSAHGKVYALTNFNASRYRLLMCEEDDLHYDFDQWDEVLPENEDILQDFWLHKSGMILAQYSHNISSRLSIYDAYGNQDGVVHLPKYSVVQGVSCSSSTQHIYYSVSGFVHPTTHYKLETPLSEPEHVWEREALQGDADIHMDQLWAESKDGVRIPFFCLSLKNKAHAPLPTIIYGYGGFNIPVEPSYLSGMRPWVLAGGRIVFANLRGGSEFGEEWHKGGSLKFKQNTFNDCHAIARYLQAEGLAGSDQLGVMGGSNGGLLVSAVTIQEPELYRAGAALVPLTDMLEFYKHQVAEFWVHEYGDPRIAEQKAWIEQWSPYHYPLSETAIYPALYYETALHDARVHPFHALKMVARLQKHIHKAHGPLLLRTMTDTGHQSSNLSKKEIARRSAEVYQFFARELGLTI